MTYFREGPEMCDKGREGSKLAENSLTYLWTAYRALLGLLLRSAPTLDKTLDRYKNLYKNLDRLNSIVVKPSGNLNILSHWDKT